MIWQMIAFLIPLMVASLIQSVAATANAIYVGQMLGTESFAAMATVNPIVFFFATIGLTASSGVSILVARAWGANNLQQLGARIRTGLYTAAALGVLVALIGFVSIDLLLAMFQSSSTLDPNTKLYALVVFLCLPIQFIAMTISGVLRSTGSPQAPLHMSIVGLLVTLVVTPLILTSTLGKTHGVAGAGISLFVAQACSLIWTYWRSTKHGNLVVVPPKGEWAIDRSLIFSIIKLGVPVTLFSLAASVADLGIISLVSKHGTEALAGWGAMRQILAYVQIPAMALAITTSTFSAQAYGGNDHDQIRKLVVAGLSLSIGILGALALISSFFGSSLIGIFVRDVEVIDLAGPMLKIPVWGILAMGMAGVLTSAMRACSYILIPTIASLFCTIFLLNPVALLFDHTSGFSGILMAYPLTYCAALLAQWVLYIRFRSSSKFAMMQPSIR